MLPLLEKSHARSTKGTTILPFIRKTLGVHQISASPSYFEGGHSLRAVLLCCYGKDSRNVSHWPTNIIYQAQTNANSINLSLSWSRVHCWSHCLRENGFHIVIRTDQNISHCFFSRLFYQVFTTVYFIYHSYPFTSPSFIAFFTFHNFTT